jgi:polyisoprenyl-teichoic acid--peptidoglycan teichoic acid transferase
MPPMRIGQFLTLFIILALVPVTACGAYFAYTQSRQRVEELNEVTPLEDTDLGKVFRLVVGIDDASDYELVENESTAIPPQLSFDNPTPVPTESLPVDGSTPNPSTTQEASPDATEVAETNPIELELPPIDPRRVNILLMGIDQREGEEGQFRTDTMIVMSLDPVGKTGAMLSIPRDLWVTIPGTGNQGRINTANYVGDDPPLNYPGGGPSLAMLTIERLLGITLDHYMLINFDAFTTLIDTIGNIEICVQERIDDPKYPDGSYGFNPIVIEAGCQDMDGTRLLQYARTRATPNSDFDRATRQQEVILAVRDKILSAGGATALLGDALTIWESVSANVRTDMTLDEIIALGLVAQEVKDIRQGTIGTQEVLEGTGPDGSEILIPIQTDIFALVADLFRPPSRPAVDASEGTGITLDPENLPMEVREEASIIALLNGTDIAGRARNLQAFIGDYNLDVGFIGNAVDFPNVVDTSIVYYGDNDASAEYVAAILATFNGNRMPSVTRGEGTYENGDLVVIIGRDLSVPQLVEIE